MAQRSPNNQKQRFPARACPHFGARAGDRVIGERRRDAPADAHVLAGLASGGAVITVPPCSFCVETGESRMELTGAQHEHGITARG
jgi:hypothetical protein